MLEIRLLGGFDLLLDGNPVLIPSRAAQTLLAYLLLNSQTGHRREKLSGVIWPESTDAIARRNLRQALWYLRRALGDAEDSRATYILADEIWVAFNTQAEYQLDVGLLDEGAPEKCTTEDLLRVAAAYRGDLLAGFYEDWVLLERERLSARFDRTMQVLVNRLLGEQRWTEVVDAAERWIATGHVPEPAYRALMIAHSNMGDLAAVASVYQRCRKVLEEELGVEPSEQTVDLYNTLRQGKKVAALPPALPDAILVPELKEDGPAAGESPFKGLRYFEEADADLFFGREAASARLITRLSKGDSLIAIVGASGSGKSSLVRAGLIPALRRGVPLIDGTQPPAGSEQWSIFLLTPTAHPLEALASTLTPAGESVLSTTTLIDNMAQDPRVLRLATRRLFRGPRGTSSAGHGLLIVDQFEELFTLCESEAERRAFIENLLSAAGRAPEAGQSRARANGSGASLDGPLTIVITLRADFYAHCAAYDDLRSALAANQEYIGRMDAADLRRAIEEPARIGNWAFEPGLVDLILRDMGDEPGALPLLSHSLRETWLRRRGRYLTLQGYAESGGVHGAIARTAEHVYQGLSPYEQGVARSIFLRLTELGEGTQDTRRRACLSELTPHPQDGDAVEAVLMTLAGARLITVSEDSVEVAHEALIREWPTLRQWLAEDRESLRLHRRLTAAAEAWDGMGREPGELYRGARLAQAREWAGTNAGQLNPLEQAFVDASLAEAIRETAEREAQRQREVDAAHRLAEEQSRSAALLRRRALYLAGALVVALAGVLAATWFADRANLAGQRNLVLAGQNAAIAATAQANLRDSERLRLAAEAKALAESGTSGELPALLALRSLRAGYSPQADAALVSALAHGFTRLRLAGHIQPVTAAAFSPDGKYILTGSIDGTARLSDASTGREIQVFTSYLEVLSAVFDARNQHVLAGSLDGVVHVFDIASGVEVRRFQAHTGGVNALALSPDERYLVTAGQDGTARIWDLAGGQEVHRLTGHDGPVTSAAFSPDGRSIITASGDHTARSWDASTGEQHQIYRGHTGRVVQASYSPDGQRVVTGSDDGTARTWDAVTGQELLKISLQGAVNLASFTADGMYILTGGANKIAELWNADSGEPVRQFVGSTAGIAAGGFSPDGRSLLTGLTDGSVRVWQVYPETDPVVLHRVGEGVLAAATSRDGKLLVTGQADGSIRIWNTLTWNRVGQYTVQSEPVSTLAVTPDGRRVLVGGGEAATLVDLTSGQAVQRLRGHDAAIIRVAFAPDGKWAATAGSDHRVRLWDVDSGQQLDEFIGPSGDMTSMDYAPDGRYIVAGSVASLAALFGIVREAGRIDDGGGRYFTGHTEPLTDAIFSPDGKYLLTTSRDTTARLWETGTGREVRDYLGHTSDVLAATFSPDGKYFATGSKDKTIRLWETETGRALRVLAGHDGAVTRLFFMPDGKHLLSFSEDGTARLWNVDIADTIRLACNQLFRDLSGPERSQYKIGDTLPTCN